MTLINIVFTILHLAAIFILKHLYQKRIRQIQLRSEQTVTEMNRICSQLAQNYMLAREEMLRQWILDNRQWVETVSTLTSNMDEIADQLELSYYAHPELVKRIRDSTKVLAQELAVIRFKDYLNNKDIV